MKLFMSWYLYEALKKDITSIADVVLAYSWNEQKLIRYPHGHVYQTKKNEPKKLSKSEIEPEKLLTFCLLIQSQWKSILLKSTKMLLMLFLMITEKHLMRQL
jgi:hypothetical protein